MTAYFKRPQLKLYTDVSYEMVLNFYTNWINFPILLYVLYEEKHGNYKKRYFVHDSLKIQKRSTITLGS